MIETRTFDHKGYKNKATYHFNKFKRALGFEDREVTDLDRRARLNDYYNRNPHKLIERGVKESKKEINKKAATSKDDRILRSNDNLIKAIRSTGSKYSPGLYKSAAAKYATPLMAVPVPGTTAVVGSTILGASLVDHAKLSYLKKRHKSVRDAHDNYKKLSRSIKKEERAQNLKAKALRIKKRRENKIRSAKIRRSKLIHKKVWKR